MHFVNVFLGGPGEVSVEEASCDELYVTLQET